MSTIPFTKKRCKVLDTIRTKAIKSGKMLPKRIPPEGSSQGQKLAGITESSYAPEAAAASVAGTLQGVKTYQNRQLVKKAPKTLDDALKALKPIIQKARPGDVLLNTNPGFAVSGGAFHPMMVLETKGKGSKKKVTLGEIHPGTSSTKNPKMKAPFFKEDLTKKLVHYLTAETSDPTKYDPKNFARIEGLYRHKDPTVAKNAPKNFKTLSKEKWTYGIFPKWSGKNKKIISCVDGVCRSFGNKTKAFTVAKDIKKQTNVVWKNKLSKPKPPIIAATLATYGTGSLIQKLRAPKKSNESTSKTVSQAAATVGGGTFMSPSVRSVMDAPLGVGKQKTLQILKKVVGR